ncbi:MAG: hypothetical protein ACR2P7_07965 [bacterium]
MQTKHANRFIGIIALVFALGAISATAHAQDTTLAQKLDTIKRGLLQCTYYQSVEFVRDEDPTHIVLDFVDPDRTRTLVPLHHIDRMRKFSKSYGSYGDEVIELRCRNVPGNCVQFRWDAFTEYKRISAANLLFPTDYPGCGDDNYHNVATQFELLLRENLLQ